VSRCSREDRNSDEKRDRVDVQVADDSPDEREQHAHLEIEQQHREARLLEGLERALADPPQRIRIERHQTGADRNREGRLPAENQDGERDRDGRQEQRHLLDRLNVLQLHHFSSRSALFDNL
jgi:hypothetical protein